MSTHPSDQHREQALSKLLPEAKELYAGVTEKIGVGEQISTTQLAAHAEESTEQKLPVSDKSISKTASPFEDDWR